MALLAALTAIRTLATGSRLVIDARLAGVAAGAVALPLRAPFLVVVAGGGGYRRADPVALTYRAPMRVPAPDPRIVRAESLEQVYRLRLPMPPDNFPLVWEPGDEVELRPREELEGRAAVLNVVLGCAFGMPSRLAMSWLLEAHLLDRLTQPEWHFVASRDGDVRSFMLHSEALAALAWLLSMVKWLDPAAPGTENVAEFFPDLPRGEGYAGWRSRVLSVPRDPVEAAAQLDLYYCLDWAYLAAEHRQLPLPGLIDSNAIGQRRWALEWAVVFHGPFHDPPPGWEEIDLST